MLNGGHAGAAPIQSISRIPLGVEIGKSTESSRDKHHEEAEIVPTRLAEIVRSRFSFIDGLLLARSKSSVKYKTQHSAEV